MKEWCYCFIFNKTYVIKQNLSTFFYLFLCYLKMLIIHILFCYCYDKWKNYKNVTKVYKYLAAFVKSIKILDFRFQWACVHHGFQVLQVVNHIFHISLFSLNWRVRSWHITNFIFFKKNRFFIFYQKSFSDIRFEFWRRFIRFPGFGQDVNNISREEKVFSVFLFKNTWKIMKSIYKEYMNMIYKFLEFTHTWTRCKISYFQCSHTYIHEIINISLRRRSVIFAHPQK